MAWPTTLRETWLAGKVPSTATPPTSAGAVGKATFKPGSSAVMLVEKRLVAV